MKKLFALLIVLILISQALCACAGPAADAGPKKLSIVCSIFPEYDWVKNILGDSAENVELTLLLDNGVDLHSYQPTADDIIKLSSCDLFVYVGGESDIWVEDALKEAVNKNMKVVDLMDVLGERAKQEELSEGMQLEGQDEGEAEYDEHVWLSLKNAKLFCGYIAEQLEKADPGNADAYAANVKAYIGQLDALDAEYKSAVETAKFNTLLFADRFPFRYLVDDYGLEYYAAFAGCSAETEASFETVAFLAGKLDELGLGSVLVIEGNGHDMAKTVIENTKAKNQSILTLDSMQSTTLAEAEDGASYISVMESNLDALRAALN